jgi:cellulose synthase/poly-beta-1,6-N-acetylglucosamine synthase-like glycosyltransferase
MYVADWVHQIVFAEREVYSAFMRVLGNRPLFEWFLFFFPFFVFGEVPRYVLPPVVLLINRVLGLRPENREKFARFLATKPSVSILLVGYNEEEHIAQAIESLLQFEYHNLEIIVVDDGSTDRMYERAQPYADRGLIKLFRNSSATGRQGRPAASNMAYTVSSGDFLISVDADTSFDRDALNEILGPFCDPGIGVVAGNLKPREAGLNFVTRMQALEYLQSITLWKTWLNLLGWNMQASGAFGAFRREALDDTAAWDPELAEDADLSLKIKKAGWKIEFAPRAIAMTNVPDNLAALIGQRHRWDRGILRTYYRKHLGLMRFWRFDWRNAAEMSLEFVFTILLPYFYIVWLVYMAALYPVVLAFAVAIVYLVYVAVNYLSLGVAIAASERWRDELHLFWFIPLFPLYKGLFRWVRVYSITLELFHINYEQTYLPESAWRNARRW